MTSDASPCPGLRWSTREAELLATTLRHLQEHGYDRLTVEADAGELDFYFMAGDTLALLDLSLIHI